MKKSILLALWLAAAAPCLAAPSAADKADIGRAEAYLNGVSVMKARLLQVAPDGNTSEGTLTLQRPGHLRIDYDAPSTVQIFADSSWLVYKDKSLDQLSFVDIDSSPAGLLVKAHLSLESDGLAVTNVAHKPGLLEITVIKQADPRQGKITLIFSEAPFQLKQWAVVDAQGQLTTVSLYDPHFDAKFDSRWFQYRESPG